MNTAVHVLTWKIRQKTVTSQAFCSAKASIKRLERQQADERGFQADERGGLHMLLAKLPGCFFGGSQNTTFSVPPQS
ncbi:hypothetical protein [Thiolapillus sp.]